MSSNTYWQRREAEALKHRITDEKEYDRQIKRIYSNMLDACQKEITAFYGKYAAKEGITIAEAKKRVKKADIAEFERKAKRYVRDKDFSAKANEDMRLYNTMMKINRLEMLKANIGLEMIAGHDELEKFMGGILKGRTEDELKRQAGILGKTVLNNAAKADAIVNASFHNATFSDRIWMYQDLLKDELDKALQSGLIQGKNPRLLARDIKAKFNASTFHAERLMRTELARVQTDAQKQSFVRNGYEQYEFIVNGGCCDICQALSGKHFKVAKMMPGENAPPMHPHCRCSTAAWVDGKDYEGWLNYLESGGTTAEWDKMTAADKAKFAQGLTKSSKSATMQSEFKEATTIEEAREYLKSLGIETSYDFKDVDLGVANMIGYEISRMYDTFGNLHEMGVLDEIFVTSGKTNYYAAYNRGMKTMLLNKKTIRYKSSMKKMGDDAKAQKDIGFWSTGEAAHSVRHELGHAIDYAFVRDKGILNNPKADAITMLNQSVTDACGITKWHSDDRSHFKSAGDKISYYALMNDKEFVAESVAEYMTGNPRETAQKVIDILLKGGEN